MKQSDIFSIILVASIGTFAAYFLCQMWLGDPKEARAEFVGPYSIISAKLTDPDPEVFNSTAINPTIEVYVGDCEDIDHNGILDEEETRLCRCDKNHDGSLDEEEKALCRKYDQCDVNKNGVIDDDEEECSRAFDAANSALSGEGDEENEGDAENEDDEENNSGDEPESGA